MKKSSKCLYISSTFFGGMLPFFALSCSSWKTNDNEKVKIIKELPFTNYHQGFSTSNSFITSYYTEDEGVPYVDVHELITNLTGRNSLKYFYIESAFSDQLTIKNLVNGTKIVINWKDNTISMGPYSNFVELGDDEYNSAYSEGVKRLSIDITENPIDLFFDLSKYDLDILKYKNKILLPYPIFNTLFCSQNYYNIIYNGNKYAGIELVYNDSDNKEFRKKLEKDSPFLNHLTESFKKDNYNSLLFTLDYYYSLMPEFKIYPDFKKFIETNPELKSKLTDALLGNDNAKRREAYYYLFEDLLADLHTSLQAMPINQDFILDSEENIKRAVTVSDFHELKANENNNRNQYRKIRNELIVQRKHKNWSNYEFLDDQDINEKNYEKNQWQYGPMLFHNYKKNFAVIKFDKFEVKRPEIGQNKSTFDFVYEAVKNVRSYNSSVKKYASHLNKNYKKVENIVIDLSTNGGGAIASMIRVLGILTDKNIPINNFNTLNKIGYFEQWEVDVDLDKNYKNDAATEFNYYVLIGPNTYSAANLFASIVKDLKLGTLIGKRSSGGGSAILPLVLPDGTNFIISGPQTLRNVQNQSIEYGIDPDIKIELKDFYDFDYLDNIINLTK
ncbi:S41 family peptidase [Mycoplasmopsis opalescens]|uniref:S41 family peptidase n=1 Tax=Mycoplasmopsis opalescens TaxID=114886 RepID=UPI0004A6FA0B|nr:S41 family peptidase [Mycoplasmopsis opalescens]